MGIIYDGPYAEDVNRDALHEGDVVRLWPDGLITSGWDDGSTGHSGLSGACGCGWQSRRVRPPGEDDSPEYEAALRDFLTEHLDPLIDEARRQSWPRWVVSVTASANRIADLAASGRLDDADDQLKALRAQVTSQLPVIAELRAEAEHRPARDLSSAVLVFTPLTETPPPSRWTRPAPPPPATQAGPGHSR